MEFNQFTDFAKKPGIYYFKNTLNNKYYIGQAQEIRDRLMKHKTNFETNYYPDAHLYRAWRKYGIDVFEVGILEIVDLPIGEERNKKLDELEMNYIKQYNSYGTSGYNQTIGGDGGIKGYKFTDLQKQRVRINGLQMSIDGRNKIYFFDTKTNQYGEALSFQIILDTLNKNNNRYVEKQTCYFGRYIFSKTKEQLEVKKDKFYSRNYYYSLTNDIDNVTKDFQKAIDKRTAEIRKEINDFFEKYGHAKYNRKDNKAKKDALRKLQKEDLMNGISKEDYKQKYNIKSNQTFYDHVKNLYPDWEPLIKTSNEVRCYHIPADHMTEEMKADILNGIIPIRFIQKYNSSEASYYRYKHKLEKELNIKIIVSSYKKPGKAISQEQEDDILNGINCIEYMKKYNLSEKTYYEHKKIIAKKHPEHQFQKNNTYKVKVNINLIYDDIINGISKREFCMKYNLSESCYKKYVKLLTNNERTPSTLTEEMRRDIERSMHVDEYCKKYNVSKSTYYNHKSVIVKQKNIKISTTHENFQIISNIQKIDLLAGMNMLSYTLKYKCSSDTYYKHRKIVIPDVKQRTNKKFVFCGIQKGISEEQIYDIQNNISENEFIEKYKVLKSIYQRYKSVILSIIESEEL